MTEADRDAYTKAKVLADAAAILLSRAGKHVRSTTTHRTRAVNYWVCDTQARARRMRDWIDDHVSGSESFCGHGQPPGLCSGNGCKRKGTP